MKKKDDRIINLEGLSKSDRILLRILMQEIADVRRELKEDIHELDVRLSGKIDSVALDLKSLTVKVDKNQVALVKNIEDLDRRVTVLEMAA